MAEQSGASFPQNEQHQSESGPRWMVMSQILRQPKSNYQTLSNEEDEILEDLIVTSGNISTAELQNRPAESPPTAGQSADIESDLGSNLQEILVSESPKRQSHHLSDETLRSFDASKKDSSGSNALLDQIKKSAALDPVKEEDIYKSESSLRTPGEPWYQPHIGIIYMIISVAFASSIGFAIKALSKSDERIPVLELIVIRGCIGFLIALGLMCYYRIPNWFGTKETLYMLLVRGSTGFIAVVLSFWTLTTLSLGDATVLSFLSPTFTGILGLYFLKERWEIADALTGLCALVGILFIAKPPFLFGSRNKGTVDPIILPDDTMLPGIIDTEFEESLNSTMVMGDMAATAFSEPIWGHNQTHFNGTVWSYSQAPPPEPAFVIPQEILRLSGVVTGVLSAAFAASAMISIRKLNKMGAHMFQIVSYFHWVAIPYSLIVAPLLPKWIEPLPWILPTKVSTWALILVVSVSGIMSQLCLSQALKIEKAGKVASISYMQVIFAFIGEFIFWGVLPSGTSILGALIIIGAMVALAIIRIQKEAKRKEQELQAKGLELMTVVKSERLETKA